MLGFFNCRTGELDSCFSYVLVKFPKEGVGATFIRQCWTLHCTAQQTDSNRNATNLIICIYREHGHEQEKKRDYSPLISAKKMAPGDPQCHIETLHLQ